MKNTQYNVKLPNMYKTILFSFVFFDTVNLRFCPVTL